MKKPNTQARCGILVAASFAAAYGCGSGDHPAAFDSSDGSGGSDAGDDGSNDGPGPNNGNPTYQPNFIQRGRPPGPPERGYTAALPELSGSGEGQLCALCADSGDCAAGACVIHMDTGEMFCAAECGSDGDCPNPQAQECVSVDGAGSAQCVPRLGTCYDFDASAEPINPIHEPPPGLGQGQGGQGGAGG